MLKFHVILTTPWLVIPSKFSLLNLQLTSSKHQNGLNLDFTITMFTNDGMNIKQSLKLKISFLFYSIMHHVYIIINV